MGGNDVQSYDVAQCTIEIIDDVTETGSWCPIEAQGMCGTYLLSLNGLQEVPAQPTTAQNQSVTSTCGVCSAAGAVAQTVASASTVFLSAASNVAEAIGRTCLRASGRRRARALSRTPAQP